MLTSILINQNCMCFPKSPGHRITGLNLTLKWYIWKVNSKLYGFFPSSNHSLKKKLGFIYILVNIIQELGKKVQNDSEFEMLIDKPFN